jgi:CRP-like cAMP-binding protein
VPSRTKSARPPDTGERPLNKLLAGLPAADFLRVRAHLKTVPTRAKQVFHRANETTTEVYFLNGGVASVTTAMKNGVMVEIATIGTEGVVGMAALFGGEIPIVETMMQVPDTNAEVMPIAAFLAEMKREGAFAKAVRRYSQGLLMLMTQSTGCLALHAVQERCARWLLMAHDRVGRDQFRLSHEFLAMMLGSSRPTVSVIASTLQKAGLIKYVHGRITIVDRKNLEAAACECYATVRDHFERLGLMTGGPVQGGGESSASERNQQGA